MPRYLVTIHGTNFVVDVDGVVAARGFYTMRFVDAGGTDEAELKAIQAIRDDTSLRKIVHNSSDDPPVMDVEEITEVNSNDEAKDVPPGYIWYEPNREGESGGSNGISRRNTLAVLRRLFGAVFRRADR